MIGRILLQRYLADQLNEHASAKINAAITTFDLDAFLATHEQQIIQAQSEGWEVRIRIAIDTNWQGTEYGSVLMKANVADCQLLYENQPQPAPYSRSQGGFASYALRTHVDSAWDSQTIEILLEGTDLQQRRYQKSRAEIEAMLNVSAAGRTVEFESLLLRGQMGKIPLNELHDYTEHKRKRAEARGDTAAVKYWLSMETLAIGPVDNLIDQAKIKGLPLADLRQYALDTAAVAGGSGDRASQHSYHIWSTAVRRIDAPLTDQQSGDRQRYLWSQPASDAELGAYRSRITALEREIAALEQQVATLQRTDARNAEERAGGEPPHPPWARINQEVEEIARLKDDLVVERLMLRDAERKARPTR